MERDQEQFIALGTPGIEQKEGKVGVLWSFGTEFEISEAVNQLERIHKYSMM